MRFIKMSIQIINDQYIWLKNHADDLGESMNTIIRRALTEYRKNHE